MVVVGPAYDLWIYGLVVCGERGEGEWWWVMGRESVDRVGVGMGYCVVTRHRGVVGALEEGMFGSWREDGDGAGVGILVVVMVVMMV